MQKKAELKQQEPAEPVKGKLTGKESEYTVRELAEQAGSLLKTMPECVWAALGSGPSETFTVSEAKKKVDKFLQKEVM